jgi:hypothetical protein
MIFARREGQSACVINSSKVSNFEQIVIWLQDRVRELYDVVSKNWAISGVQNLRPHGKKSHGVIAARKIAAPLFPIYGGIH